MLAFVPGVAVLPVASLGFRGCCRHAQARMRVFVVNPLTCCPPVTHDRPCPVQAGFHEFLAKCDQMEIDENKLKGLAAQNAQRQRQREEQLQREKYLTKPLSEIVSGDTEVGVGLGSPVTVCMGSHGDQAEESCFHIYTHCQAAL